LPLKKFAQVLTLAATALRASTEHRRAFNTNAETFAEHGGTGQVERSYSVTMTDVTQITDFVLMRFVAEFKLPPASHGTPCP
jgi:hypothetical protein